MTRSEGLLTNSLPTGMKYRIVPTDYNPSLYMIRKEGETGPVIAELSGLYTGVAKAQKPLTRHINDVWDRFEKKAAGK